MTDLEPMSRHVSWRAGGAAQRVFKPADVAALQHFLAGLSPAEPVLFVGLGSNLLVRDGGYRGTVVLMHNTHGGIRVEEHGLVHVEAGVACPKLARFAAGHALEGGEFLAGIPGTVGGALAMNAGCHGSETWDFVSRVQTIDRSGDLRVRQPAEFSLGYRHCQPATERGEEWFTAAWFEFPDGDMARARERIRDLLLRRVATQPLNQPNAGSVFRNPPGDHAARLIEACGLKGFMMGGAQVSTRHANFIVNATGTAVAADIERLIGHVRRVVHERFGVDLEPEVRIVGESVQ